MHEKQSVFLIDNVTDGLSLHSVETGHLIRSFPTKPSIPKSKDVAFGEKGTIVVGGGDRGSVYVFDRKQGTQLQKLQHAREGMVQSIAVRPWQLQQIYIREFSAPPRCMTGRHIPRSSLPCQATLQTRKSLSGGTNIVGRGVRTLHRRRALK